MTRSEREAARREREREATGGMYGWLSKTPKPGPDFYARRIKNRFGDTTTWCRKPKRRPARR
jgi:hypothetical protein